jgi:hypothetical protein
MAPFGEDTGRPLFSEKAKHFLKHISISFNSRPKNSEVLGHVSWEEMELDRAFNTMSQWDRQYYVHGWAMGRLSTTWQFKSWDLSLCLSVRKLEYLEIDLTNAYCLYACCRPHRACFVERLVHTKQPARLTFLGMKNGEEEKMMVRIKTYLDIQDDVGSGLSQDQIRSRHNITFNPDQDIWAEWKEPHGDEKREN